VSLELLLRGSARARDLWSASPWKAALEGHVALAACDFDSPPAILKPSVLAAFAARDAMCPCAPSQGTARVPLARWPGMPAHVLIHAYDRDSGPRRGVRSRC